MKLDDFMDALGQVEDRYVVSAGRRAARRKRRWNMWLTATAAVLVLGIGAGALATGKLGSGRPEAGTDVNLFTNGNNGGSAENSVDSADSLLPPEAPAEAPADVPPPGAEPAAPPGDGEDALPNDSLSGSAEYADPENEEDYVKLSGAKLLAAPFYPARVARTEATYSQWAKEQEQLALSNDDEEPFRPYLAKTLPALLKGQGGENTVCTPMNLYLALSMLAETAGGDSQQQILDLLGEDDLETIRTQASRMWNALYMADGASHLDLASSLWLRTGLTYSQKVLQSLATNYFASAYSGTPGTTAYDTALQTWINEHTDYLLERQTSALHMDPNTALALVSTVSYQDSWLMGFPESATTEGVFHTPGGDVPAMLMHSTLPFCPLWQTDHFTAIQLELANSQMLLILPNEGTAPEDLLEDPAAIALLSGETAEQEHTTAEVSLTLPRFDVHASAELKETLQSLAVSDVFDPACANFEPLEVRFEDGTPDAIAVSRVLQAARVSIDEFGCQGAGFIYIDIKDGAALPDEQGPVALTFDRPFLFAVQKENLPVFAGIVNIP